MPIEFRCTQCNRLLRTQDDTAGKQAKCPECGAILTIPGPATPPGPTTPPSGGPESPFGPAVAPGAGAGSPFVSGGAAEAENPYASPADYTVAAPPAHTLVPGPIVPTRIEVGDVFGRAWEIFKDNMGLCIGAVVIVGIINYVVAQIANVSSSMVGAAADDEVVAVVFALLGSCAAQLFALWLNIGQGLLFLKVGRGQEASLADVFRGGPYYLTVLGASLLVSLICFAGFLLLIVPGIIFALMFSQVFYLILDRNVGITESLELSKQITSGNKAMIFLLWLLSAGLILAGFLMCCVGLFFTVPLSTLMWTVAYLAMTGQPTADQVRTGPSIA